MRYKIISSRYTTFQKTMFLGFQKIVCFEICRKAVIIIIIVTIIFDMVMTCNSLMRFQDISYCPFHIKLVACVLWATAARVTAHPLRLLQASSSAAQLSLE